MLINLLRQLEKESGFKAEYMDTDEELNCVYSNEEYLDFPDFRYIIKRFNEENVVERNGLIIPYTQNSIRGELKRMEADGLIMIGTQTGKRWATPVQGNGPDIENVDFTTESVVLTTQGKSNWAYFRQQLNENPITTTLSILALLVSIGVAIFK